MITVSLEFSDLPALHARPPSPPLHSPSSPSLDIECCFRVGYQSKRENLFPLKGIFNLGIDQLIYNHFDIAAQLIQ